MSTSTQVLAVIIGIGLVSVWVMEAFMYRHPRLYPLLLIEPGEHDAVRMWSINVGFYNLMFALALFVGVAMLHTGYLAEGRALVLFAAAAHVVLGVVLYASQRRLWLSALMQSVPPAVLLGLAVTA